MTEVIVHPKDLADALENAYVCSKEKLAPHRLEHVLLSYTETGINVYGMGAYLGGRTQVPSESAPAEQIECAILREEAHELRGALRKVRGGRSATVAVAIHEEPVAVKFDGEIVWANVVVRDGGEVLIALPDSDPEGDSDRFFTWLDGKIGAEMTPAQQPVMFTVETLSRLKDVKSDGPAIDLLQHPTEGVLHVAIGSRFRGLIATVNVPGYVQGGPWGTGPGKPEHLLIER